MAFLKNSLKKAIPALLVLVLCLTLLPVYGAAEEGEADPAWIETDRLGSITVKKYASNAGTDTFATGMEGQTIPADYSPLDGVTFKLYRIAGVEDVMAYYNGTSETSYDIAKFQYAEAENGAATATYDGTPLGEPIGVKVTGESASGTGTCSFKDLPVGIYALTETDAPAHITGERAQNALIAIPMVNTADDTQGSDNTGNAEQSRWQYNIFVYPKNRASASVTLEVVKQDGTTPLENTAFRLYKWDEEKQNWELVQVTVDGETKEDSVTGPEGTIQLKNLSAAQYKLEEVSAPKGYIINRNPMYFKVNADNTITWNTKGDYKNENQDVLAPQSPTGHFDNLLSITLRKEQPELYMQVKNNEDSAWVQDDQYMLGGTLTYRITAYVPHNVGELDTFEIRNLPGVGITDSDTVTVCYGGSADSCTTLLPDTKYTFATTAAGTDEGKGFSLSLKDTTAAGQYIQIEYTGYMNENAVIAEEKDGSVTKGNPSNATLTYSRYIGGTDTGNYTITDETRVYTYQFRITKYKDREQTGNEIGGVVFQLLNNNGNTIPVVPVTGKTGVYRVAREGETGSTQTMETAENGTLTIQGLENNTYSLKETKTISGYNLLSQPFAMEVDVKETTQWQADTGYQETERVVHHYENTTYEMKDAAGAYAEAANPIKQAAIVNKKGFTLPRTGSMGYLLFCTVGILLIGGGAMLLFGGRKKKIR